MEELGEGTTKAKGLDDGVDGGEELSDEDVDEAQELVELAGLDGDAGGTGEGLDDLLEQTLDLLENGDDVGVRVVLRDLALLVLLNGGVCALLLAGAS